MSNSLGNLNGILYRCSKATELWCLGSLTTENIAGSLEELPDVNELGIVCDMPAHVYRSSSID